MTHLLAQAIKLPGLNGTPMPVNYPPEFNSFLFKGQNGTIAAILNNALPLIIGIAGLGLLVMLISAGFTLLSSAGDAKKMEKGRGQLTNAIVGFIIIFGAYWIIQLFGIMFGTAVTTGFK